MRDLAQGAGPDPGAGIEPNVVDYVNVAPSVPAIKAALRAMAMTPRD